MDINRHLLPELASTIWNSIESVFQEGEGEGGVRDLQLPESRSCICQIPVYRTNKMKNTVTGKNCTLNVTREETSNSINHKFLKSNLTKARVMRNECKYK